MNVAERNVHSKIRLCTRPECVWYSRCFVYVLPLLETVFKRNKHKIFGNSKNLKNTHTDSKFPAVSFVLVQREETQYYEALIIQRIWAVAAPFNLTTTRLFANLKRLEVKAAMKIPTRYCTFCA